jgi:hypothetical protein
MEVETRNRILLALKKESLLAALMSLVVFSTAVAAEQAPTFHGIKLGVSLGSQFQECPWNPPKERDIPDHIDTPFNDKEGNPIPCFFLPLPYTPTPHSKVQTVELIERVTLLKDGKGDVISPQPLPELPVVYIQVFVPASAQLGDGTVEGVMLLYLPLEADRVKDALVKKFGTSHPPDDKVSPKLVEEFLGAKIISREVWRTNWGELFLGVTGKDVSVLAKTAKLRNFEQEHERDEF